MVVIFLFFIEFTENVNKKCRIEFDFMIENTFSFKFQQTKDYRIQTSDTVMYLNYFSKLIVKKDEEQQNCILNLRYNLNISTLLHTF